MEKQRTVAQRAAQAITLIDSLPAIFARQGAVVQTWRTKDGRTTGPYFELRYRQGGCQERVYLGADQEAAQQVREHLDLRRGPARRLRQLRQARREILRSLRKWKAYFREQLRPLGLSIKGNEFRGWSRVRRDSPEAVRVLSVPRPSVLSMIRQSFAFHERQAVECWAAATTLVGWKPWAFNLPSPDRFTTVPFVSGNYICVNRMIAASETA